MVWLSCIIIPLFLWLYASFLKPLVNRWRGIEEPKEAPPLEDKVIAKYGHLEDKVTKYGHFRPGMHSHGLCTCIHHPF